ncbi:type I polyketide synthase [Mycolicibacterium sp.]|uniref:type I polyketide synthase n=1 Tax=Mycolicibacterium sp. TaxID=2320850 RepID=UPI001D8D66DF|nr:type I polyketide synthase [Mycolicibacterium sp.]MCB1290721.1 SDR family NAD(P)-dependent oxidoreductase [Mycobacterium sp.]MCB9409055.1 SDR family NAD(P)-dependent oxidoreductase [Mycolicibacterium sp.]
MATNRHPTERTPRFAIIGYAARLPGAADADRYWDVLHDGRDAISEVPVDRWDADEFFDPDPAARGKVVTRRAGFVDDATGFDAPFFGVSTREAKLMDPQHRLLLETAWRAVEHSGIAPTDLANTRTGVFVGLSTHDYLGMCSDVLTYPEIEAYLAIGTSSAAGAGRISYRLGLQGPAVTVDTACSSSLVAIHQACQALLLGECDLALAGGANVLLSPATMITFSQSRMLAPDGRCKTFDAAADGYVRGEGCGVIAIKRLEDAVRDGDRIRAVIRGSAVNQDGASGGLTVPNGIAQQRVISDALDRAGLVADEIDYLEAHGTGTSLGDPIEVQAAAAVLGRGRAPDRPLLIGSAKTNIGHLEAAAGVAGVLKVILSLEHAEIPKHLNFRNPSPHIPWDRIAVRVVDEPVAWERGERPRIAGVSSFGFSGTNAHVIIEEAPAPSPTAAPAASDPPSFRVLPLSARTPAALGQTAASYRDWLSAHPEASLADVCLTAGAGRAHFERRAALVVNSLESARELLDALADDLPAPGLVRGDCADAPKTAWLFPGQGSQYVGMARELFDTEPVFAETMRRCADATADLMDRPLLDVVFGDPDDPAAVEALQQTRHAQPAIFAVEMGLARLWQSWGLAPDVVLGHSVGQYAAACVAGIFSLENGVRLLAERGRLFGELPAGGRMAAIFAVPDRVERFTDEFPSLSVAAYNGANTVLSGPAADLETVVARLTADGARCEWLETSHAFHSALLDPALDAFESFASGFEFGSPQRILICNRTGAALGRNAKLDGTYWRRHSRQPVEFAKGVATLAGLGCSLLLEVGPQPVLTAAALRAWPDTAPTPKAIASLRRNVDDQRQITEAVAGVYIAGHRPDFAALVGGPALKLDLPTYPFEHREYWFTDQQPKTGDSTVQNTSTRTEAVQLLEDGRIEELAALLDSSGGPNSPGDSNTTVDVLKLFAAQHNRQRSAQSIADIRYEVRWEKSGATAAVAGEDALWLVVGDGTDVGPLVHALTADGCRHRVIELPGSDTDEQNLVAELRAAALDESAVRILHVAALDSGPSSMGSLLRMQHRVLGGTQRLFRAAATADLPGSIWVFTRGAQRIEAADTVAPEQRSLWGFCRAAALEYPQVWGGLADLVSTGTDDWPRVIRRVGAPLTGEDQIALREHGVHVPRLVRRTGQPKPEDLRLRGDATYLVTGGLGSIGLEIAGYLASHGAGQLVLTSRRAPDAATAAQIDELGERHGCAVRVMTADVADPHDVARLLSAVQSELPPLAGVIHAAGENSTTPLSSLDEAELDRVFSGKVWGAWYLSEAVADLKLDFFVSISSISSVWGSYGQSAYSAANAYLDGLTWRLRERGVPAVSVNFGPLSTGMADAGARAQLELRGVHTLSPTEALTGMADVMAAAGSGTPEAVVARIDWSRFLPIYLQAGPRALLDEVAREVPAPASAPAGATALVERLTAAPVQQRRKLVLDLVRNTVAEVTRVDVAEIREEAGFFDLGMDSLMAIELRRQLEQAVGSELPATLAMDHPRLVDVADYLLGDVLSLDDRAESRAAIQTAQPAASATDEPIAIIAVACRFPGSPDADAYWDVLSGGVDAIREIPEDRFDVDEFYDPDQQTPGKIYTREGGYLQRVDEFDPEFFGISPREAVWMDPQQRLMLEIAWEGLERAGYSPASLRGSRTGVFIGVGANEYAHLMSSDSVDNLEPYFITGNALNAVAGRVSFTLGLEGPAVAMDTACSSSLVAVHQATQALHSGDCDMALAGGVNILLSPASMVAASRARMLSPDGRCKTFDAAADGYVRGEGCGVLVLKRLSDAHRDGDRICAVIRSSAVNQDGASSGLTVPNGGAQQRLIASALARAGLLGPDIDYLEAHGTGTPLGDPIEVQAAAAVYGAGRDPDRPLLMGTAKTNIGHIESAAGVAGLIKVVLSLQHQLLPQNLHFHTPNPHIPWESLPVRVVEKPTPWQPNGRPRRAGVSSFGFTGTNAHVLIEEAPRPATIAENVVGVSDEAEVAQTPREPWSVLPLSARTAPGLLALAHRYSAWLAEHPEASLPDVCFVAGAGRSHFEHRAALVANSIHETRLLLEDLVANRHRPGVLRGECTDPPTTAWLFPGQGSQYIGMARELFGTEPVFTETVHRCAEAVDPILPRPLLDVLLSNDREAAETLRHTSFAQPAIFAVEMGLARLWQSWGIEPDVVLGHSVGQYAAACVAGVFSLEDGARLIAERGRLFGSLPAGGRMVAVFADPGYVLQSAEAFPRVSVGAYNGRNTVLSGPGEDLERIVATCSQDGTRCTWLETSHAFHSELLDPVLDEFESFAGQFSYAAPTLPLVCNRTGAVLTADTPIDAHYWRKHSRQPVQFTESVATVASLGCSVLMEIGPQPILSATALQIWPESAAAPSTIVSLRKGSNAQRQMTEALAAAYISGHRPNFAARQHTPVRTLDLPTYPFQRRRFWPKISGVWAGGSATSGILGSARDLASGDTVYSTVLSVKTQPWLAHHVIYGTVVVPGATYATMALAAVGAPARVKEVFFYEPIILPEKAAREVQLTMHPLEAESGWRFQVHSRPHGVRDAEWSLNSDGTVLAGAATEASTSETVTAAAPLDEAIERLTRTSPQRLFETFNDMELAWGPTWSTSLKSLWVGDGEAIGDVSVGDELAEHLGGEPMHPVLLDLCTGVAFPAFPALTAVEHGVSDLFLPLRYGQVELRGPMPRRFYCRARWHTAGVEGETQVFDIDFLDREGRRLGGINEFTVKRAPREALMRGLGGDATRLLYTLGWHEAPTPGSADADSTQGTWLIAGFDELAAAVPGSVTLDPCAGAENWEQAFASAAEDGNPVAGIVWRSAGRAGDEVSTSDLAERLDTEIAGLLAAAQTALAAEKPNLTGGLWIVTERAVATEPGEPVDPVNAALWGAGRTIIAEQPTLRCRLLDLDTSDSAGWLAGALRTPVAEPEMAVRQGKFLVSRLLHWARSGHLPMPRSEDYVLAPTERGAIDNLRLVEKEVSSPASNEIQVRVEAAGLNFRDILNVLGLYPGDPGPIGGDLCGIVTEIGSDVTGFEVGQRVFGSMQGAFASRLNVPAPLLTPVPEGTGPVGAATLPAAALTARLAFDWAQLKPGDRVLIHAASGGVGMAAIQLARHRGATVFATASAHKRATLREMGVEYVYDSRTTDFAEQILADTDGAGVDVVLNSLTNEGFVEATVRATAKGGRFAEIAKRDIWTAEQMAAVRADIEYGVIALDVTMMNDPEHIQTLMVEVADGLAKGEWTPVPAEVYPLTEARAAFRRMQQARHIGKIIVQMPKPLQPRGDRTYLVTGGLGALGLHTAGYLAQLGAGDIVLTSRSGPDADAEQAIAAMTERFHCRIHVMLADVGDETEAAGLLERIRTELPPLAGIAHLAGVLDDALLPQQSPERFRTTLRPKAYGAHHLHHLTLGDDLEFFILYSSASAVLGSPSQANYACANALLDGLVAQRRAKGLQATAVNFGPWGRGGMASSQAALANLSAQGMLPLEPSAALAALGEVVRHGTAQATVLKANWQRTAKMLGGIRPPMLDQVLPTADGAATGDSELLRQLQEIPEAQQAGFVTEFLQREVQGFLRLAQPPAATSRFLDLGTDSLMAVELRNRLFSQFGGKFDISPTAVFDYPTIGELAVHLVSQLPDTDTQSTPTEPHPGPEVAAADPTGPESAGQSGPTPRD